jgi:replicative DNA helicase
MKQEDLMPERLNDEFLEKIIIKGAMIDKMFLILISNAFISDYFQNEQAGKIYEVLKNHVEEFKTIPSRDIIVNLAGDPAINEYISEALEANINIQADYDFLVEQTNIYLKDQAIKKAMLESVGVIDSHGDLDIIRQGIEDALCKDLKVDLGLNYFEQLGERLRRIFTATDIRIPTYYPKFDEFINGGFPALTLSVILAQIHGFKSNTMINFASRQVLHGHNVVLLTLEMSEDMTAQRFDSIYSLLDINRMYHGDLKTQLAGTLREIKATENRGELFIKQYPTGAASVRDFRIYLRELLIRGIKPSIVYVDYINLMRAAFKKTDDLYMSVSQLNREGSFVGFEELGFNYIAESHGIPAVADFMGIFGINQDERIYKCELHNKIVKNRLGGRIDEIWKCFYDDRNLKMYDETELDTWIAEVERELAPPPREAVTRRGR